ncbi:MAG: shikimate kinase [Rhodospirillales bacterium]|nr:shikimate kinase [Rhodospirillales bacterium]
MPVLTAGGIARPIVLVGLMGAGKTSMGRLLARRLGVGFADSDEEIVKAAAMSIADIFRIYGEAAFRDGERRVMKRLLEEGARVLASGGGAFIDAETRKQIRARATSVWLRAELDVLLARTVGRPGRPLLDKGDPRAVLEALMTARYPVYAEADIVVDTTNEEKAVTVERIMHALAAAGAVAGIAAGAAAGRAGLR